MTVSRFFCIASSAGANQVRFGGYVLSHP